MAQHLAREPLIDQAVVAGIERPPMKLASFKATTRRVRAMST